MFAATEASGTELFYFILLIAVVGVCVKMYLLVFRPEVWDMHQRREEEAKQRRAERLGKAAKGAALLYKWLKK